MRTEVVQVGTPSHSGWVVSDASLDADIISNYDPDGHTGQGIETEKVRAQVAAEHRICSECESKVEFFSPEAAILANVDPGNNAFFTSFAAETRGNGALPGVRVCRNCDIWETVEAMVVHGRVHTEILK